MRNEVNMNPVSYEVEEQILTLTLRRPEKLNALTPTMLESILAALDRAEAPDVRVVVICGEGTSFCAGADVVESLGMPDVARASAFLERIAEILRRISALPKPVVAAVQGHAAGGGAEIALEADFRVVADDARVWFPDVGIGSTPASVWHLVRLVGRSVAMDMVMLGLPLDAKAMQRHEMVHAVVSREQLPAVARTLAGRLRDAGSELSMRHAKRAVHLATNSSREQDLQANVAAMLVCYWSDEQRNTVDRFRDGRSTSPTTGMQV